MNITLKINGITTSAPDSDDKKIGKKKFFNLNLVIASFKYPSRMIAQSKRDFISYISDNTKL